MSYPPSWGSYSKGCPSVTFVDPPSFDGYNFSLQSDELSCSCDLRISGVLLTRTVLRPPPFLPHEGGVYSVARVNLTSPGHPHRGALLCTFRFGKKTGIVRPSHCPEGVVLEQSYRFRRRWCSDCCHQDTARMFVDHQVNTWTWKTMLLGIGHKKPWNFTTKERNGKFHDTLSQVFVFCNLFFLSFRIALPSLPNSSFQEICEGKHDFFEGQVCMIPQRLVQNNAVWTALWGWIWYHFCS